MVRLASESCSYVRRHVRCLSNLPNAAELLSSVAVDVGAAPSAVLCVKAIVMLGAGRGLPDHDCVGFCSLDSVVDH